MPRIDLKRVAVLVGALRARHGDGGAVLDQEMRQGRDVGENGNMAQEERFLGEEHRRHKRQRRILGAADGDGAGKRLAATDANLIHH